MLDTSKLPRLQPQSQSPDSEDERPQESLPHQIYAAFFSKKGVIYLTCAFVLIYISMCVQGERLIQQGLYKIFKDLGQDGFGISYNAPSSYFAFKSGVNLDDLVITAPEQMGSWILTTGRITVSSTPFTPRQVTIRFNGTHSLKTKTIGDIRLIIGQGEAELRLPDKKEPLSLNLSLKQVQTASPKSMEGFFISDLELHAAQIPPMKNDEKKDSIPLRFSLHSDAIHLPAYLSGHLPPMLQKFDAQGILSGRSNLQINSFLTGWLNSSGTVEIEQSDIVWPPFSAQMTGTFSLNDSFELIGAGIAKTYGFFELLDMFQKGDYLRPRRVSVAKVVLGEQMKQDAARKPFLSSAFSIQAGKIYTGPVLLYDSHEK